MPPAPDAPASLDQASASAGTLLQALRSHHFGDDANVELLVAAFIAGGHVLIEGAPGLGKTRLVRTMASQLGLNFGRIQCTPDLMPSDITGSEILYAKEKELRFLQGPVFCNVLLADEINRATPRTQSALLEAMEEKQVTAGEQSHPLPTPFFLAATQNPIELEGTYPLPEAQLDRFLFKLVLSRPNVDTLQKILETQGEEQKSFEPLPANAVADIQKLASFLPLPAGITKQVAVLVAATHPEDASAPAIVREHVRWGASPRAGIAIVSGARALAMLRGQAHISPSDLCDVALSALRHRLTLRFEAVAGGVSVEEIVSDILKHHPIQ
ncbi:MAG TPA: AAA family ATPase [Planctomycetota bacterium]|nr:AAA family ATPase [Planctomycetota bacterium]HJM38511.1 AAA family ATPase [Planctomycetota bacterium]